jgi:hypothetical protein
MYLIANLTSKILWTIVLYSEKLGIMISIPESRSGDLGVLVNSIVVLDFELSLCSVLTVSTFGCIPSAWFSVGSIFKGFKPLEMDPTEGSETSANINQTLGIHPKVETVSIVIGSNL